MQGLPTPNIAPLKRRKSLEPEVVIPKPKTMPDSVNTDCVASNVEINDMVSQCHGERNDPEGHEVSGTLQHDAAGITVAWEMAREDAAPIKPMEKYPGLLLSSTSRVSWKLTLFSMIKLNPLRDVFGAIVKLMSPRQISRNLRHFTLTP